MNHYPCRDCTGYTLHRHLHDTAHGIAETHMAGSERFVCQSCGNVVRAVDPEAVDFPFCLDVPTKRGVEVRRRKTA